MTRTLLLLRHAKSSWKEVDLADQARPLNGRGRRDAPRAGARLAAADLIPERVLCSTAVRARQTAEAAVTAWGGEPGDIEFVDELYHASSDTVRDLLRELPDSVGRVLVIGHNPDLEWLLTEHTGQAEDLPTAAVAVLELDLDRWADLAADTPGRLTRLWRPKQEVEA